MEYKTSFNYRRGKKYDLSTKCVICDCIFTDKTGKVKHHQWDAKVVKDAVTRKVTKCNYIGALCSQCNMNITTKLNKLPLFAHNAIHNDNHFVLFGITDDFTPPSLLSKAGENFLEIDVTPVTESEKKTYRLRLR